MNIIKLQNKIVSFPFIFIYIVINYIEYKKCKNQKLKKYLKNQNYCLIFKFYLNPIIYRINELKLQ